MRVLGINGIRSDGAKNTDRLLGQLAPLGWSTQDVNYPRVSLLRFWFTGRRWRRDYQYRAARCLVNAAEPGDALIAHSFGGLLALRSMELGAQYSAVFLFAPALDRDAVFPAHGAKRIYVIHNPKDVALFWAARLLFHDAGEMGRTGYAGPPDARVANIRANDVAHEPLHHSDYFLPSNIARWAAWVHAQLGAVPVPEHSSWLRRPEPLGA